MDAVVGYSSSFLFKLFKLAKIQFVLMTFVLFQISLLMGTISASKLNSCSSYWRFYI